MTKQQSPKQIARWFGAAGLFILQATGVFLLVLALGWLLVQWAAAWAS